MSNELLLNERQAAKSLTVGEKCLQAWRTRGGGPAYIKIGRLIRYRQTDLDNWIEQRKRTSTSDEATSNHKVARQAGR